MNNISPQQLHLILQQNPIFQNLEQEVLQQCIAEGTIIQIPKQTIFIEQDSTDTDVYFILEGLVRVFRETEEGDSAPIYLYGPHTIIGEMATLIDGKRSASVETIYDTTLLKWGGQKFKSLYERNLQLISNLATLFAKRLYLQAVDKEKNRSKNISERVHNILEAISYITNTKTIDITQDELAHIIGVTRPRLNEALHDLENKKILRIEHKKIVLHECSLKNRISVAKALV